MRHPFLIISLAFVLLSPAALSWLGTAWLRPIIREGAEAQLRQGMDVADLTILVFAKSETERLLDWEHERGFEYEAEMYDVVQKANRGGSLIDTCYPDHAEFIDQPRAGKGSADV